MIYPTRASVISVLMGAPLALIVAIVAPTHWPLSIAWPLLIVLLCLAEGFSLRGRPEVSADFPAATFVGETVDGTIRVSFPGSVGRAEVALPRSTLLGMPDDGRSSVEPVADDGRDRMADFRLSTLRRGTADLASVWLRWTGRLGLVWRQTQFAIDRNIGIFPDLRPITRHGIALLKRFTIEGNVRQLTRGDGSDFDSLADFRTGMDKRAIDWKQSAKNTKLLAKLYLGERSSQITFAIDCSRAMSDPIGGLARIDRAISAALLTAWVALKLGDRVSLFSFDSSPRVVTPVFAGPRAFSQLQQSATTIDYSSEESNFVFALSRLSQRLNRRSMIVLFTEITDDASADFLMRALKPLVERHLVLVVALRDEELEELVSATLEEYDDVTRSITASALLHDRSTIINRLRHLGVNVIETHWDRLGQSLAEAYLGYKRRTQI